MAADLDLGGVTAELVATLAAAFTDAGLGSVAVTSDPRQIVPPCVFVDLLELDTHQSRGLWSGTTTVHLIATPDPDAAGREWLDQLTGVALAALDPVATGTVGQPFTGLPGTVGLPEYAIDVQVTVNVIQGE